MQGADARLIVKQKYDRQGKKAQAEKHTSNVKWASNIFCTSKKTPPIIFSTADISLSVSLFLSTCIKT